MRAPSDNCTAALDAHLGKLKRVREGTCGGQDRLRNPCFDTGSKELLFGKPLLGAMRLGMLGLQQGALCPGAAANARLNGVKRGSNSAAGGPRVAVRVEGVATGGGKKSLGAR